MSTRCQIGIYESEEKVLEDFGVLLYKHSDGYIEGVVPLIQPFLKEFAEQRGIEDVEYCGAWLMHHMCAEYAQIARDGSMTPFVGHGICGDRQLHGDIEYYYRIHPGKILVHKVERKYEGGEYPDPTWEDMKLVATVDIATGKITQEV